MKKRYFVFILSVFCCISIFGDNATHEEVDFLLFSPNSSDRFENEEQAFIQLNKLAQYLSNKNLTPGQIIVCGYAAYAPNKIMSVDLSRDRALTVMEELQKRGISKNLFSDPVGYGAVSLWGNNTDEDARKLNRRVRILLQGEFPVSITQEIIAAEIESPEVEAGNPVVVQEEPAVRKYTPEDTPKKSSSKFPWWVFPVLALLFLFIILLLRARSRKPVHKVHKDRTTSVQPQIQKTDIKSVPAEAIVTYTVNLDEEIRLRAYELSQQRDGRDDYRDQDWYNAVREISAWYIANGHSVFTDGGYWWASSTGAARPVEDF